MVVKCLLCLESPTIPGPRFLEIFGEEGLRLDISSIINKHFWLKTNRNSEDGQQVCLTCWEVVRDFHILYQRVEEVHKQLGVKTIVLDDPLPQDVLLKSEDDQDPIREDNDLEDALFDPEVKVEVHDLDLLPQLEILETANVPERGPRGGRRGRQAAREQSPKISAKRIKKEQSPAADADGTHKKDGLNNLEPLEDPDNILLSKSLEKDESSNKKKGRPKRGAVEKSKSTTTRAKRSKKQQQPIQPAEADIKDEEDAEELPSCSTAQLAAEASAEPKIKTENPTEEQNNDDFADAPETFDDDDAYAQDDHEEDNYSTKDSNESSDAESEAEESEGSDWNESKKKGEKFAVITKKERNVPKKYKKRAKPAVEPKRLSREEIEARQAQQAEYDSIITKFFEKIRCPKCELLVHTFNELRAHFRADHNDDHGFVECCGRRFATRKFLAEHILVHYNPEHFKCKTCEKVCRDSTQLESHEQTHLPNPPPSKYKKTFQCEKCSKTFSSKASFEHHMVAKHVPREEFKFECPECKKKLPSETKLREHMNSHDPTKRQICDKCGKTFKNNYNMKKHEESEHSEVKPEPQQCTICNTWYRNIAGLKTHMKNMHDDRDQEHRCNICNKVSTTQRALKRHIYLNHKCEKKFKCNMCEKAFKRGQDLREHISVHTGEALYTCPNCPMTFSSSANMYKHRQRLHKAEYAAHKQQPMPSNIIKQAKSGSAYKIRTKKRFVESSVSSSNNDLVMSNYSNITSVIGINSALLKSHILHDTQFSLFPAKKKLNAHIRTHAPDRLHLCYKCGKAFKNKRSVQKHDSIEHLNLKPEPQQCTICNLWYSSRSGLLEHMRNTHDSTGKEHRCDICNHVSTTGKALKRHIHLNHNCKDRYKCKVCEKSFNRSLYLKEHMATHTGEVLYACPHCPTTFTHNANVYKHFQNVHKAEYTVYRQQAEPPNILKIAKQTSEKIRNKKLLTDSTIICSKDGLDVSSDVVVVAVDNNDISDIEMRSTNSN